MTNTNYISSKAQDHFDARDEQQDQVREYLRASVPLTRPRREATRWSDFHQGYVTVRL